MITLRTRGLCDLITNGVVAKKYRRFADIKWAATSLVLFFSVVIIGLLLAPKNSTHISQLTMTEWCIVIMDKPGADRAQFASEHIAGILRAKESGTLLSGGQINDESTPRKPIGSHLQIRANSKDEAMEFLKKDPFAKGGVWDMGSAAVYQFDGAYREKLDLQL